MNKEETLALYEQGVEAWNKWANEMLEERKRLEEAGEWEVESDYYNPQIPQNDKTQSWLIRAQADFSSEEAPHIFENDNYFSNLIFPGKAWFESCTFKGKSWFKNVTFNGEVSFHTTTFYGENRFSKTTFKEKASFNNSKFFKEALFDTTTFNQGAFFITVLFKKFTTFQEAKFNSVTNFTALNSESEFSLQYAEFKSSLPYFIQANFKEAPRLDNIKIEPNVSPGSFLNSITTFIHPDNKASYQALKRLAVQAHDHENEQRFWAGELRSDRSLRNEDGSWNRRPLVSAFWWGNIAYGCASDYGRSIVRPIGALLILIGLMTGLHLTTSKTPLTYENTFSAGYISTNKSFLYLGTDPTKRSIINEKYTALYGANENQTPKIPKTILTAEIIQTLLSAIFIFLALLGIRNNFKMK